VRSHVRRKSHHTALSNAAARNSDCPTEPRHPIPNPHRASPGAAACIQLVAAYISIDVVVDGDKLPKFVVFETISTIKDEESAAKFHYIKTVSAKVVAQSIAFRVVSLYWQGVSPFP